jgi:hypothetical protein
VARYQTDESGTRETHDVPARVWANKPPINGKEVQTASWESDELGVVIKQGNACGAKGLAGEPRSRALLPDLERDQESQQDSTP